MGLGEPKAGTRRGRDWGPSGSHSHGLPPKGTRHTACATAVLLLTALLSLAPSALANHLTNVNVSAPQQTTGAFETWTIQFNTHQTVPDNGGYIKVDFPDDFMTVPQFTMCDIDGREGETTNVNPGDVVVCNLQAGTGEIPGGSLVRVFISNVQNPTVAEFTNAFVISTGYNQGAQDLTIDQDNANQETISPSTLANFTAAGSPQTAGATTTWGINFTNINAIAANGDIRIVFPLGFNLAGGSTCLIQGKGGITTTRVSATEIVCGLGQNSINANTAVSVSVSSVQNPPAAQTTGTFRVETRDPQDRIHDWHTTNTETITVHAFTEGPTQSSPSLVAGAVNNHTFTFKVFNAWASNGKLQVTFPNGYAFNSGGTTTAAFTAGGSGTLDAPSISGQTISFTRAGGATITSGTSVSLQVSKIKNPTTAGNTSTFTVATANVTGALHDSGTAPGVTIASSTTTTTTTSSTSSITSTTTGSATSNSSGGTTEMSSSSDAVVSSSAASSTPGETGSANANETEENEEESEGKSPALGTVLVLGIILATVIALRRRE